MAYIERETAIKSLLNDSPEQVSYSREDAADCIRYMDAADVAPVRHGRWLNKKEWHLGRWVAWLECSCCGEHDDNAEMYEMLPFGAGPSNYCPNCGAKMEQES